MGGCVSRVNNGIRKLDEISRHTFDRIGLESEDIRKFAYFFRCVDIRQIGRVSSTELFNKLEIEKDKLNKKLFSFFDIDGNDALDFCEFTLSFWHFLTLDVPSIPGFVFHLFDADNNMQLDFTELQQVVEVTHKTTLTRNRLLRSLAEDLQDSAPLSRTQFIKYCSTHISVCQPLLALQLNLQDKFLGTDFWSQLSYRRHCDPSLSQPDFYMSLRQQIAKQKCLNKSEQGQLKSWHIRQAKLEDYHKRKSSLHQTEIQRNDSIFSYFSMSLANGKTPPAPPSVSSDSQQLHHRQKRTLFLKTESDNYQSDLRGYEADFDTSDKSSVDKSVDEKSDDSEIETYGDLMKRMMMTKRMNFISSLGETQLLIRSR
jgi:Ca2+-binding EF-hand superfamily protein